MDSFGSKTKMPKRYLSGGFEKTEEKYENAKPDMEEMKTSVGSTKKIKEEDKGFVFSLSHFEEKNRASRGAGSKTELPQPTSPESEPRDSMDKDQDAKRKMIYGSESFKEKYEEEFPSSVESNNDLFSMVFLNKSKPAESPAPVGSFTKAKSATKIEQPFEDNGIGVGDF